MPEQTTVTEHPILMSGAMVRAILAGKKAMTRRVVAPANSTVNGYPATRKCWPGLLFDHAEPMTKSSLMVAIVGRDEAPGDPHLSVPYCHPDDLAAWGGDVRKLGWARVRPGWEVGDRLYVKEKHLLCKGSSTPAGSHDASYCCFPDGSQSFKNGGYYHQDKPVTGTWPKGHRWRSSIHMPRWASRITLQIESIRAERLQSITEEDAYAEGIEEWTSADQTFSPVVRFHELWDRINGKKHPWSSNCWVWVLSFRRVDVAGPPVVVPGGNLRGPGDGR